MNTTSQPPSQSRAPGRALAPALLVVAGLVALYTPTVAELARSFWPQPTYSHGPLVLAAVLWLLASKTWAHLRTAGTPQPRPRAGAALLLVGLPLCVLARPQHVVHLELVSLALVLAGCVLGLFGWRLLRRLGFAFFFLLFLIPAPQPLVDAVTHPMKLWVAQATELLLHAMGVPVARSEVLLSVGPYQLMVADACAGLNSLFMLEAFGLLYLHVVRHVSALRNALLALLIVPISFAANVLRVLVLALVTLRFGDAAGQSFIHGFSGMVLFAAALLLLAPLDGLLRRLGNTR